MKQVLSYFLIATAFACSAQDPVKEFTYDGFEKQILSFQPVQKEGLSKSDLDHGSMIIRETKSSVKNSTGNFNLADYFNVLSAFLTLKESEENISVAYEKFISAEGSCEYVLAFADAFTNKAKYEVVREEYMRDLSKCKANQPLKEEVNIPEYSKAKGFDTALVELVSQIAQNDTKYRSEPNVEWSKQTPLDMKNQELVYSLFNVYGSYIGKSLVGEKFETAMWAVIQHSTPGMMEKYLPIVHEAVQDKELSVAPLKMLIDRLYGLKHGYQIFGSQSGLDIELANEKTRELVKKKYGID